MTALERLTRAWDKADARSRRDFLSFLDQWQAMRRDELERAKAQHLAEKIAVEGLR